MTDGGRPPLEASGLKLADRLAAVASSRDRVAGKKGLPKELTRLRAVLDKGLEATESMWPAVRVAFGWIQRAAAILANEKGLNAAGVRRRYRDLIAALARQRTSCGGLAEALDHFRKSLVRRQATRALGRRFRRDPQAYPRSLEDSLINQTLPS